MEENISETWEANRYLKVQPCQLCNNPYDPFNTENKH